MVHFTKLRLTGFKSFVDPTEVPIAPGLTGIVGPNGCGKSNLVEALRWAMGETSAKRMRGGEMDDVIFGGSVSRPARNVAEVVLTLDNATRNVPAQFNEFGELEVARRIERGSGSAYRVNGKEVRARDVQLLFADAASGAHSTALVSQGRVGALINAKPTDRRALLEEAAGITGLHSRRHEAELRLHAAEANLARLDDVIVTLEGQYQALKKQARQAARYRGISEHLRRTEAALLHLQWVEATARLAESTAALAAAESAVADLTGQAAAAGARQGEVAADLPALRQAEVAAAAELQRLTLARDGLDQEEARVVTARAEAAQRLAQLDDDIRRETALGADAAAGEARLAEELTRLDAADDPAAIEDAARALVAIRATVEESEASLAESTQRLAAGEARAAALAQRIGELETRIARLRQRADETATERRRLEAATRNDAPLTAARELLGVAESALERAQAAARETEQARLDADAAAAAARERLQAAQAAHARLAAEAEALAAMFAAAAPLSAQAGQSEPWPPLVDALRVTPGFEAALGAALGDDLVAAADDGAPVHWTLLPETDSAAPLPADTEPLSRYVEGVPALARRLSQIGVVADDAAGARLRGQLVQGQRLVSRDGAMWRWDGFTVAPGAPTAALTRLRQRGRLDALRPELERAEAALVAAEREFAAGHAAALAAAEAERARRQSQQAAYDTLGEARASHAAAAQAATATASLLAAAQAAAGDLAVDLAEAESELTAARQGRAALSDLDADREAVAALRSRLNEQRAESMERASAHDRLQRAAEARTDRRAAIADERRSWAERAAAAAQRLEAFAARRGAAETEIERLARRPAEIAEQRHALLDLIDGAAAKRGEAADRLAAAETRLAEADRELKAAEARLAEAREHRIRAEAAVAQGEQAATVLRGRIRERLDCEPDAVPDIAGLAADAEPPAREALEAKLQRLLRERESMGPVNLRAEAEAAELDRQINSLQSERADLTAAIARLRQGIASLNREGRERLLAAFALVNGHFEKLFTRLFGGGRAMLKLTEAEDPLEAGLEIMASPPGKRLQVLSLLSGGEQALTALALLFAVFLTNPAPVCVLDEVDAPLDDANVDRFCTLVEELAHGTATRFLLITHHRMTMARMDRLFGVTMSERGVSRLVSVDLQAAVEMRASA